VRAFGDQGALRPPGPPAKDLLPPVRSAVVVRDINGPDELRACQGVQRRAWGITEDGYVVPVATMVAAQKVGGLVLGAFDGATLVGFSFAFLGRLHGQLVLYSQLTGVEPGLQARGVGRLLKFEQRRRARETGLASVAWAFDPLQASNASFNLAVLGATSRTYEVNMYGPRTDALNAGLATDRLLVEWATSSEPTRVDPNDWQEAPDGQQGASRLRIPIPADLVALKAMPERAIAYQHEVRAAFQAAFAAGYVAVGFARGEQPAYLLERRT
jgi:predicted GNAT superfamily acetyltransferase